MASAVVPTASPDEQPPFPFRGAGLRARAIRFAVVAVLAEISVVLPRTCSHGRRWSSASCPAGGRHVVRAVPGGWRSSWQPLPPQEWEVLRRIRDTVFGLGPPAAGPQAERGDPRAVQRPVPPVPEVSFTGPVDGALESGGRTRLVALLRKALVVIGRVRFARHPPLITAGVRRPPRNPTEVRESARCRRLASAGCRGAQPGDHLEPDSVITTELGRRAALAAARRVRRG